MHEKKTRLSASCPTSRSGNVDLFYYHNYVQLSSPEALKKSVLVNGVDLSCRKLPEK